MWRALVSVTAPLYYVAIMFFIVQCGIEHFLCAMSVFKVRASSSSRWLPLCQFCFFCGLHCWVSPWRKIAYSLTHPAYFMPREPKGLRFGKQQHKQIDNIRHLCCPICDSFAESVQIDQFWKLDSVPSHQQALTLWWNHRNCINFSIFCSFISLK